jgi:hypothetical protein
MSEKLRSILVGIYAWITAVLFGATLLDVVYAKLLKNILDPSESILVFSEVSDTLLFFGFIMIVAASGAMVSAWKFETTRNFFIASILVFFLGLLVPVFFPFLKYTQGSAWARLLLSGTVPLLAFIGLDRYYRQKLY